MFSTIRNRLTIRYTSVMAIFLITFIMVSFSGMLWVLYLEEQQEIKAFAEEESKEHLTLFKQNGFKSELAAADNDTREKKLFVYLFDIHGQLIKSEEPVKKMRPKIEELISTWKAADGEGKLRRFYLADGERAVVMMCSLPIYDGEQVFGRVYVGEDITAYYELLKILLIVLVVVSLLFLLLATFIAHFLAGRTIIPIRQVFLRQREFVADASHELRTPLSILLTSVDAVQTDDENQLSPFSAQVLEDMKSEVRRMTKMVSDLLTLARADAGVVNIIKTKFDLYTVAEQVIRSFQAAADEKGVKLTLDSEQNQVAFADRERINQLLLILVDNAIKYTPDGGRVDVVIRTTTGSRPNIEIIVQDTGIGISAEDSKRIFDRFYRVDKVRSREEGGTGIGLSIAKWIVQAHGGTIKVESTPGQGSSFSVKLPN